MELTFLVDNNSLIKAQLLAEPALSMFIRSEGRQVLFDAGYSDAFMINARRMGIDLLHLDWIVLSHGHFDHTWGLDYLIRHHLESKEQKMDMTIPALVAHPQALVSKQCRGLPEIGSLLTEEKLSRHFDVRLTERPTQLSNSLTTLGEIERVFDFETGLTLGERMDTDGPVPDDLPDDTALACVTDSGLVVIAGCAHAGICNTVEQAKRVTGVDNVRAVLGGFHLQQAKPERLNPTAEYLAALELEGLWCCHCTDLAAKIALAAKCPVREVGSGLTLKFQAVGCLMKDLGPTAYISIYSGSVTLRSRRTLPIRPDCGGFLCRCYGASPKEGPYGGGFYLYSTLPKLVRFR